MINDTTKLSECLRVNIIIGKILVYWLCWFTEWFSIINWRPSSNKGVTNKTIIVSAHFVATLHAHNPMIFCGFPFAWRIRFVGWKSYKSLKGFPVALSCQLISLHRGTLFLWCLSRAFFFLTKIFPISILGFLLFELLFRCVLLISPAVLVISE